MRRATVLLGAAVAAVLALPLPASAVPPAREVGNTGPALTSVALSTDKVSVSGLDTVPVSVTVTASGYPGACPEAPAASASPARAPRCGTARPRGP